VTKAAGQAGPAWSRTLLPLAVAPPEAVTPEGTLLLARSLVTGVLGTGFPALPHNDADNGPDYA
jgi:hypothetical protein